VSTVASKKKTAKEQRIKVTLNGPYLVTGGVPLSEQIILINDDGDPQGWREGKRYPAQESYALCRCGMTGNRPFCDGTHVKRGFDGTEVADTGPLLDGTVVTEGPALKLNDIEELCASARFCHRAGGTWDLVEQSGDPQARKIAIETSADCPSGRLVLTDKKSGKIIEPVFERSIGIVEDPQAGLGGPIWVRGGILVECADGKVYEIRNRVTLCRCGRSHNKPFCDSAHMHGW